jgi:hypothetical protein
MVRVASLSLPVMLAGCFDEPPSPGAAVPIFDDAFTAGFTPNAFADSVVTSLGVDFTKGYTGTRSVRLNVPASGAGYSGGAVLADTAQDLSGTNALVFWATASRDASFDQVGFGLNFNPYPSPYRVTVSGIGLTTGWTRHLIPVPDASKLTAERGMLWWAEADPTAYTAWLDDVKFDFIDPALMSLEPATGTTPRTILVGGTARVGGLRLDYTDFDATPRSLVTPASYFSFASSDPSIARVDSTGKITGVGLGQAVITASLGPLTAAGGVPVDVVDVLPTAPTVAPARPTQAAGDVISLLSGAYTNRPVTTWRTPWSLATLQDVTVGGDAMKKYSALNYAGVEFPGANAIDASAMEYLHLDVWTPDAVQFRVQLQDYGAGGNFGGGDDSGHELAFDNDSTPEVVAGTWVSLDLPLSRFAGLTSRSHLALLVLAACTGFTSEGRCPDPPAAAATVWVDNVYFHK